MSEENLALVASVYSEAREYVDLLDPQVSEAWIAKVGPLYAPDYEFHAVLEGADRMIRRGQDGYLAFMVDWLTPWESYMIAADDVRDLEPPQVAVLTRHLARLKGGGRDVATLGLDLWTVREGLFLRLEAYMDRQLGLKAAGLG
jgi:hypothetical protein